MKIKMLAGFSGEWSCNRGDEIERPRKEALRLIEAGYAVAVREDKPETATKKTRGVERAAK